MSKQQSIRLVIDGSSVKVYSPYHSDFVYRARKLRGEWNGNAWVFDETMLDYVRDLMVKCYGVTGETPYDTCILVAVIHDDEAYGKGYELFGRTIAKAWGRDSGAKLGDDVYLIEGTVGSGGSVKNWKTTVRGAILEIHDFPIERTKHEDVQAALEEGWLTLKMPKPKARLKEQIEADLQEAISRVNALRIELESVEL